jgi:hypothetical protein
VERVVVAVEVVEVAEVVQRAVEVVDSPLARRTGCPSRFPPLVGSMLVVDRPVKLCSLAARGILRLLVAGRRWLGVVARTSHR